MYKYITIILTGAAPNPFPMSPKRFATMIENTNTNTRRTTPANRDFETGKLKYQLRILFEICAIIKKTRLPF